MIKTKTRTQWALIAGLRVLARAKDTPANTRWKAIQALAQLEGIPLTEPEEKPRTQSTVNVKKLQSLLEQNVA